MFRAILITVIILSVLHIFMGVMSITVGTANSIKAVVWRAHRISPIWSGAFFVFTGMLGIASVKRQTSYIILCFTAFSMVSLVTAVIAIQLLRLGLVIHTTDGQTYRKKNLDGLVLFALAAEGTECLICLVSAFVSCRMAKLAKLELYRKREGMFHVEVYGEKDVVVVTKERKKRITSSGGCCFMDEANEAQVTESLKYSKRHATSEV